MSLSNAQPGFYLSGSARNGDGALSEATSRTRQGAAAMAFRITMGGGLVLVLAANLPGHMTLDSVVAMVEASGGKAVAVTSYARTSAGLLAAARKLTNYDARHAAAAKTAALRPDGTIASVSHNLAPVGFDAILIADSGSIAAAVAPALAQFGATPVLIMGTELWNSEPAIAPKAIFPMSFHSSGPDLNT